MLYFYFKKPKIPIQDAYYNLHIKNSKLYDIDTILLNNKTMKIWFFPMVADILHSWHIIAIEEAKKHCDYLTIWLHCNPLYKSPQQSIYERFMQLRWVKWIDEIIPYYNIEKDKNMFLSLDYDVYFLWEDHKDTDWEMRKEIEKLWKEIVFLKRQHWYSSTRIKNFNKKQNGK